MTDWTVQVLDESNNVKYQSSVTGTEEQARSLVETFEKKYRNDVKKRDQANAANVAQREKRGFY